jgi:hypothetical protein
MKNVPKGQYLLFMGTEWHSKLATFSCTIYSKKPHIVFLKKAEES